MEYPFKDLMPLDEATARDGYYRDWTHIDADTFHQISELAKFIREKGHGADTREAIAQALERVYHDAAISGNANMEVSQARGSYPTLAERLIADFNKLNSDKISKGQVEASDLMQSVLDIIDKKIAKGQVTMADLTQEVKEALTGGSVAVVGDYGTGLNNLASEVFDFLKYNIDGIKDVPVTAGKWVDTTNGNVADFTNSNYGVSGKIKIPLNTETITHNFRTITDGTAGWSLYDQTGKYLKGGKEMTINVAGLNPLYIQFTDYDTTKTFTGRYVIFGGKGNVKPTNFHPDTVALLNGRPQQVKPIFEKEYWLNSNGEKISWATNTKYAVSPMIEIPFGTAFIKTNAKGVDGGNASWVLSDKDKQPIKTGQYFDVIFMRRQARYIQLTNYDETSVHDVSIRFIAKGSKESAGAVIQPKLTQSFVTVPNGSRYILTGNTSYKGTQQLIEIPEGTLAIKHNFLSYTGDGGGQWGLYDENQKFIRTGKEQYIKLAGNEKYISLTNFKVDYLRDDMFLKVMFVFDEELASLANKSVNFIGDSITYGENPDPQDVNTTTSITTRLRPFSETVAKLTGALTTNYGYGGRTLCVDRDINNLSAINMVDKVNPYADINFVLIGINDLHTTKTLGQFGDTTEATFYGGLDMLGRKMTDKFKISEGKQIVWATYFDYDRREDWSEWMDAIRITARKYAIPVCDLMYESRVNPKTDNGTLFAYRADGLKDPHPKQAGQNAMGTYIAHYLQRMFGQG